MRATDRDDALRPAPARQFGGKWKGRGQRRLQNEGRRDSREQDRGGRERLGLRDREVARLLEDWAEVDE
jgi:hypothetical protein